MKQHPWIVLILILLLAWALRIVALDHWALWFDEGVSLTFGHMPLPEVVQFSNLWQDTNPPVHRQLMGRWTDLVGVTAFNARLLSVLAGTLAVALTYRIARQLGLAWPQVAAFLLAVAPMQVYYSREAKSYAFTQLCLLVLVWLALNQFRQNKPVIPPLAAGALSALAVFSAFGAHYMMALGIIAIDLWVLWRSLILWRGPVEGVAQRAGAWFGGHVLGVLPILVWALLTLEGAQAGAANAATDAALAPRGLLPYLFAHLSEYAAGPIAPDWLAISLATILAAWLVISALPQATHRSREASVLLWLWALLPIVLGFVAQIGVPFFFPRFLLFVTPAFALLSADTASRLSSFQAIGWTLALTALAGLALALAAHFTRTQNLPDLRPLAGELHGARQH
ncbi:MAG: hypothetical protein GYB68_12230, partial [Chloroflexi bacterium]|nr:hypothetical protein [Chloroflexota bacterium]